MDATDADKTLARAFDMPPPNQRSISKANFLQEETGRFGEYEVEYRFSQKTQDILLAHGRRDAAHALLNTSSLLEHAARMSAQLRFLNVLAVVSVSLLGAIVIKLYA
jgi:hypothetical protein